MTYEQKAYAAGLLSFRSEPLRNKAYRYGFEGNDNLNSGVTDTNKTINELKQ
jgi:hypothetical protein